MSNYSEDSNSPSEILRIADVSLYRAEGEGRDRVSSAPPRIVEERLTRAHKTYGGRGRPAT